MQDRGKTSTSFRYSRSRRDSTISRQRQMTCGKKQILQNSSKKEVDRILREMTLKIISPVYNNQPGTITREHLNPTLVSYAIVLHRKTAHGPTLQNVVTPRHFKRSCVILYIAHNVFSEIRENKRQNRTPSVATTNNSRARDIVTRIGWLYNDYLERWTARKNSKNIR